MGTADTTRDGKAAPAVSDSDFEVAFPPVETTIDR